jgi:casein kinase II subunit alpha
VNERNKHLCPPEALDLLEQIMLYDHANRITPKEAMGHKYFDPVRDHALNNSRIDI